MGYFGFSWFRVGSYCSNYVNYFTLEKKVKFNKKGKRSKESRKKFALLKIFKEKMVAKQSVTYL